MNPSDLNLNEYFGIMVFLFMLILYTMIGSFMEQNKPCIGHETGIIMLITGTMSYILSAFDEKFT